MESSPTPPTFHSSNSSSSCMIPSSMVSTNTIHPHSSGTKHIDYEYNTKDSHAGDNGRKRTSIYRGVTRHKRTGRYEAQLWDKGGLNNNQNKKGKHVYLGSFDDEEAAAHAYDLGALKYWGPKTVLNFPANMYIKEYHEMQSMSNEEYIAFLRHHGNDFAKDISEYHGVEQHHKSVGWEARIGGISHNKYNSLEIYANKEEATHAYDYAAVEHSGLDITTNFPIGDRLQQAPQILDVQQFSQMEEPQDVDSMRHFLSPTEPQSGGHLQVSFEDPTELFSLSYGDPMVEPEPTTMATVFYGASDSHQNFVGPIFLSSTKPQPDSHLQVPFEDPTNLLSLPYSDPVVEPEPTTMVAVLSGALDSPQNFTGPIFLSSTEPQLESHLQVPFEDPTNLFSVSYGDPVVELEPTTMAAVLYGVSNSPQNFIGPIFQPYMVPNHATDLIDDSYLNGTFEDNFENLFTELEHIEGNLGGEGDPDGRCKHNVDGKMERTNEVTKEVVVPIKDVMECPKLVEKMPPPPPSTSSIDS